MGLPRTAQRLTPSEYLRIERAAPSRSEYFNGEMFAKAGGTPVHSLIKTNVTSEFSALLKGHRCTVYDSDLRVRVPTGLYTYPDASIFCEPLEFDDEERDTVTNPTILVEVLSPSTEAYDRGRKFGHYQKIASLREYVLVSQDCAKIERFLRGGDDTWILTTVEGVDRAIGLPSIGVTVRLSEIYDKVDFPGAEAV